MARRASGLPDSMGEMMIGGPEIGVVAIVCATMISIVVPGLRILARR